MTHSVKQIVKHGSVLFDPNLFKAVTVPHAQDQVSETAAILVLQDALRFASVENFEGALELLKTSLRLAPSFAFATNYEAILSQYMVREASSSQLSVRFNTSTLPQSPLCQVGRYI